jgi:hypothetical protein
MRRFLRIRILFVLIALALVPAVVLPCAERLRTEWARYWASRVEASEEAALQAEFIPSFEDDDACVSGGCFVVVPALTTGELDLLNSERERIEAERRMVRNRQLADEVADTRIE